MEDKTHIPGGTHTRQQRQKTRKKAARLQARLSQDDLQRRKDDTCVSQGGTTWPAPTKMLDKDTHARQQLGYRSDRQKEAMGHKRGARAPQTNAARTQRLKGGTIIHKAHPRGPTGADRLPHHTRRGDKGVEAISL